MTTNLTDCNLKRYLLLEGSDVIDCEKSGQKRFQTVCFKLLGMERMEQSTCIRFIQAFEYTWSISGIWTQLQKDN